MWKYLFVEVLYFSPTTERVCVWMVAGGLECHRCVRERVCVDGRRWLRMPQVRERVCVCGWS